MAASGKQLALLKKVRSQRASRVQRLLLAARSKHKKSLLTLEQLENYRSEYQTDNNKAPAPAPAPLPGQTDDPASSTNPLQLANTARFLSKLDAAIVQQEAVVAQTTDELQQVEKQWQQLYLNDKSLGRFIEERERAIEKDAIKRDDRASQSNWLSSTLSQSE